LCIYTTFSLSIHQLLGTEADSEAWLLSSWYMNVSIRLSLLGADLHFFRYMPKSGVAGSSDICILVFWWTPYWFP
jgi:hypothetical protein